VLLVLIYTFLNAGKWCGNRTVDYKSNKVIYPSICLWKVRRRACLGLCHQSQFKFLSQILWAQEGSFCKLRLRRNWKKMGKPSVPQMCPNTCRFLCGISQPHYRLYLHIIVHQAFYYIRLIVSFQTSCTKTSPHLLPSDLECKLNDTY
jgi:hypothetical protein